LRILRRDDLPNTIPLEPSIGPNQASGFVGSVFSGHISGNGVCFFVALGSPAREFEMKVFGPEVIVSREAITAH
jgi:hypothetical protein